MPARQVCMGGRGHGGRVTGSHERWWETGRSGQGSAAQGKQSSCPPATGSRHTFIASAQKQPAAEVWGCRVGREGAARRACLQT